MNSTPSFRVRNDVIVDNLEAQHSFPVVVVPYTMAGVGDDFQGGPMHVRFNRVGNQVIASWDEVTGAVDGGVSSILLSPAIPMQFRPTTIDPLEMSMAMGIRNGTSFNTPAFLAITTAYHLRITSAAGTFDAGSLIIPQGCVAWLIN